MDTYNISAGGYLPKKNKKTPGPKMKKKNNVKELLTTQNIIPTFTLSLKMKKKQSELITISSSKDCADACRLVFDNDSIDWFESFIVLALSRSNKCVGTFKVSQGGITGTVADPRIIMQFALLSNCTSLILCHNHPSGNLKPSRQDEELTQKIKLAASYFEVRVLDHIILSSESFFSFADEGLM